jgi:hypothetical protein
MRTPRLLAAPLVLGLLALTPLVPATAAAPDATVSAVPVATGSPLAERAKPRRELNDRSVKRGGSWYIVGRVTPAGSRKAVVFKRKLSAKAPWRTWKRVKTDYRGRYKVLVEFPSATNTTWFYKGVVYGSLKYADSRTDKIYTACRRANC